MAVPTLAGINVHGAESIEPSKGANIIPFPTPLNDSSQTLVIDALGVLKTLSIIGSYTISASTQLNGAIGSTDTTINVDSTTNFSSTGAIQIDDEVILYTAKTATSFTGCTRGAGNSTAASHLDDAGTYENARSFVAAIESLIDGQQTVVQFISGVQGTLDVMVDSISAPFELPGNKCTYTIKLVQGTDLLSS